MLYGYSPFYSRGIDQIALFKRIVRSQFYFPDGSDDCEKSRCSSHGKDLIRRLLVANPDDRLGSSGPLEVYSHAWFDQFGHSASDLIAGKVKAPWIPKLKDDPLETSYFGNWAQKALDVMTDEKPLSETEQKLFQFF